MEIRHCLLILVFGLSLFGHAQVRLNDGVYEKEIQTADSIFVIKYDQLLDVPSGKYPLKAEALKQLLVAITVAYCEEQVSVSNFDARDTTLLKLLQDGVPGHKKAVKYRALKLGEKISENQGVLQIKWKDVKDLELGGEGLIVVSLDEVLTDSWEEIEENYLEDYPQIKEVYASVKTELADRFLAFEGQSAGVVYYPFACKKCLNKILSEVKGSQSEEILSSSKEDQE